MREVMTLELDLAFIKQNSYTKFQLKIPKHADEKCRKLYISNFSNFKKGYNSYENYKL